MISKPRRIRDPLHNIIEFKDDPFENTLWDLLQARPFQRLRRIKQLGFSDFVYPGATHSRFMHSLGVFHIAKRLLGHIQNLLPPDDTRRECALAAALLHDVGHGPFSHVFEDVAERLDVRLMVDHEAMTVQLIRHPEIADVLNKLRDTFSEEVATLFEAENSDIYKAVVSSQFDADRLDYMQRDRLSTGTHLGMVDYEWLLSNLEIEERPVAVESDELPGTKAQTLVINTKGVLAAESYVLNLFHLYPTVYFHKTTRGAEKIFTELLYESFMIINNGKKKGAVECGLRDDHPLVRYASERAPSVETLLALDDTTMWSAFEAMQGARNPLISDFSKRLLHRRLFKCIDIRERLGNFFAETELQKKCNTIEEQISEWNKKQGRDSEHMILMDKKSRTPYKKASEKGEDDPIRVKSGDEVRDIDEVSKVVASIPIFSLFRCYVSSRGSDAEVYVEKLLKNAVHQ